MIVDGAKALDTAVTQTFGRAALVQRCQVHKGRNILEHLPEAQRPWVKAVLTRAYTNSHVKTAKRLLQDLARRLDTDYPSAATSVREGLDETLTVLGLGLSERLQRSLATTKRHRESPQPNAPCAAPCENAGAAGRWCCAGWPPGCSKRRRGSAGCKDVKICPRWSLPSGHATRG